MAVFKLSFPSPETATPSHELRFNGDAGEIVRRRGRWARGGIAPWLHRGAMWLVARQSFPQDHRGNM